MSIQRALIGGVGQVAVRALAPYIDGQQFLTGDLLAAFHLRGTMDGRT
jgi:hypothetical protein